MPATPSGCEPIDQLKELVKEAAQYEEHGRKIISLSNKIKRMAKDLRSKKEKIKKIKTSSAYKEIKRITKKQKDYVNWAIKDAYNNITKKKKYTNELNPTIDELNRLLEQRDDAVTKLTNISQRRVDNLKENALLTHEECALAYPQPVIVWKDGSWDVDNFN